MIINGIDVTPILLGILEVALSVAVVLITTKLVPWVRSKVDNDQLILIKELVKIAVKAAEQLFEKTQGAEKLEYAKQFVIEALHEKGIEIDEALLRTYIESAVLELHKALEELEPKVNKQLLEG